MRSRLLVALAAAVALSAVPAGASANSTGTAAGLRYAVTRLLTAEIGRDGAGACAVLNAPLTGTVDGRSCTQRWDARIDGMLAAQGGARHLHADLRAVASAAVSIDGLYATISLPHPLLDGRSRFYWTDDCWMLTS
jgi:hypothetical protein